MQIRFWGTRGSLATPGPGTLRYGGNTSCVEARSDDGTIVIFDCGTGAHGLGRALMQEHDGPLSGHVLISHTHWDHIQGIPFFQPFFSPENEWHIYGPRGLGSSLRETLAGQMQYTYFPITLDQLAAKIHFHDLVEGSFRIGDVVVTTQYLHHPALTLGYRIEANGVRVVYASDHEPHSPRLAEQGYQPTGGEDDRHARFIADADLLIHDAQYTAEEYPAKKGWGHSTVEYVVDTALAAGVRRVALFHHDPLRDDNAVDKLLQHAQDRIARTGGQLDVLAAAEGHALELEATGTAHPSSAAQDVLGVSTNQPALKDQSVLISVTDPASAMALSDAVRDDKLTLHVADNAEAALRMMVSRQPSLVVFEHELGGGDALEVCRAIRREGSAYAKDVPIVVVADNEEAIDRRVAAEAGVTDVLVKPFSSTYARTRVRAWLLRQAGRWERAPLPADEDTRMRALRELCILDTAPEERFDRYTRLASSLFDVPIALVSLVDSERQWFKSHQGLDATETPREMAFCAHAILQDSVLLVSDAIQDPRFADNPLVTSEPHVRFYAGVPLALSDGSRVGTLCLIDHRPRELDEEKLALLRDLGKMVEKEFAGAPAAVSQG
jgi:phosphoribosyl 1,2-cyclic phosphodiesterase/DNA-binding response OmpR family regulator